VIRLTETGHPESFASLHLIGSRLPDDRVMLVRSGVARVGFEAGASGDWRRDQLQLVLDLRKALKRVQPRAPREGRSWAIRMEQWAVIAGPNAVVDPPVSNNAGFAVDTFRLRPLEGSQHVVELWCDLAVRDEGARLIRVGYYVTIVGTLDEAVDPFAP
jgi:hypothetical protein